MGQRVLIAALLAFALGFAFLAQAEDDDKVMGVYQGTISGKHWDGKTIRAQVVSESKFDFRAVLFVGDGTSETKATVKGSGRKGKASFSGEVDLGGKAEVKGEIANETFTGTIKAKGEGAFTLKRVFPEPPTRGKTCPADGVNLFDGKNISANWSRIPKEWCVQEDGSMQVCSSSLLTNQELGSGLYHVEFMTPFMPDERDQGRGNSGVYILGRYEVQVLDSFGNGPKDNWCGGIYKKAVPIADAVLPPLQWQTYDITLQAAQFDASGNKTKNARITVVHNGITVHDNVELDSPTPGGVSETDSAAGPLLLQDHGNPVKYRNIWFVPAK